MYPRSPGPDIPVTQKQEDDQERKKSQDGFHRYCAALNDTLDFCKVLIRLF